MIDWQQELGWDSNDVAAYEALLRQYTDEGRKDLHDDAAAEVELRRSIEIGDRT